MREITPYVAGESIGDAYESLLHTKLAGGSPHDYRTIHITKPVSSLDRVVSSIELDDWKDTVNAGAALEPFESYEFHDGTTGRFWVQDRIEELFDGMYAARLTDPRNQIEMITERLKKGNHGQTTNALVAQLFQVEPDLRMATHGRPLAPDMACLTQLQFRPKRKNLHLFSTFRSQYLDTKCYGNLISLAMLLACVCDRAGYEPGYLVETVNNATFRDYGDAKNVYNLLRNPADHPAMVARR